LTQINAAMRRIDLSCKLLAPVAVGFMMSSVSVLASAVLIAVWNVSSVGVEYWLLHHVYMAMPILQQKSTASRSQSLVESSAPGEMELGTFKPGNAVQVPESFSCLGILSSHYLSQFRDSYISPSSNSYHVYYLIFCRWKTMKKYAYWGEGESHRPDPGSPPSSRS
jgi:hypothetical protein